MHFTILVFLTGNVHYGQRNPAIFGHLRSEPLWIFFSVFHEEQKIGESYRGYCTTEAELEAIQLLHKQQTHAVFGTRQSPSPAKPATRLMWKSQYVPYDGIPFVNAGNVAFFPCGICVSEIPLFKS